MHLRVECVASFTNTNPDGHLMDHPPVDPVHPKKFKRSRPGRVAVVATDPNTGAVVHSFDSIAEAGRNGFSYQCVLNTLKGIQRTHGGFVWRRAS